MRSRHIPDVLRGDKKTAHTLTAAAPISPFSGERMIESHCRGTPVYVDQIKRVVVPKKRDGY